MSSFFLETVSQILFLSYQRSECAGASMTAPNSS